MLLMDPDRLFPADPSTRAIARELYAEVRDLPLVSPHGHVDPKLLADDAPLPDPAAGTLEHHAKLAAELDDVRVIPTFRPDAVTDPERDDWLPSVTLLGEVAGTDTGSYAGYLDALARRREDFKRAGATATDHGV